MNRTPGPAISTRIVELDALRGLAAVAVALFHYTTRFDELFGPTDGVACRFSHGFYGVHLFFMLSGFVIFMTLERSSGVLDFVVGRFSRLYPAYWVAVALTFAVVTLAQLPGEQVTPLQALINCTMLQQLLGVPSVDGAYWSLQVELLFYAAIVVLFALGAFRSPNRTLALWVAGGLVAHLVLKMQGENGGLLVGAVHKAQTLFNLKYIHLFALGILFYQRRKYGRYRREMLPIFIACLTVQWIANSWLGLLLVAGFCIMFHLIVIGRLTVLASRPLVALGGISYTLYLVHQNIGYVVIRYLTGVGFNPNGRILVALACSLLLAALLTLLIERPAMAWIRSAYRGRRIMLPQFIAPSLLPAAPRHAPTSDGAESIGAVLAAENVEA